MAISYQIHPALRCIEIIVTGAISYLDSARFHKQVATDPLFRPDLDLLIDIHHMTSVEITGTEMRQLIATTPFDPTNRRAMVYGVSPLPFGISRMYQLISESRFKNLRLFKSRAEALEWLTATTTPVNNSA